MRKILFSLASGALGLALTGAAQAHEPERHGHHTPRPAVDVRFYYRDHGVRFDAGYSYPGRDHHHWARRVWDPRFARYQYWDASLCRYYYWCPQHQCYYPTSYRPF